jgi:hypothetical protein
MAITAKEGILRMQPSGKWAVCRRGRAPVEIAAGAQFRIETPRGKGLKLTRMEFRNGPPVEYYTTGGYPLHNGLRAAIGETD